MADASHIARNKITVFFMFLLLDLETLSGLPASCIDMFTLQKTYLCWPTYMISVLEFIICYFYL